MWGWAVTDSVSHRHCAVHTALVTATLTCPAGRLCMVSMWMVGRLAATRGTCPPKGAGGHVEEGLLARPQPPWVGHPNRNPKPLSLVLSSSGPGLHAHARAHAPHPRRPGGGGARKEFRQPAAPRFRRRPQGCCRPGFFWGGVRGVLRVHACWVAPAPPLRFEAMHSRPQQAAPPMQLVDVQPIRIQEAPLPSCMHVHIRTQTPSSSLA